MVLSLSQCGRNLSSITALIRERLHRMLEEDEDAGGLTVAGATALKRFRACKAGDKPKLSSLWCSALVKIVRAGLESKQKDAPKDTPPPALAAASQLPEPEPHLARLIAKNMRLPRGLSIRMEPKRRGGTKGAGIYYPLPFRESQSSPRFSDRLGSSPAICPAVAPDAAAPCACASSSMPVGDPAYTVPRRLTKRKI